MRRPFGVTLYSGPNSQGFGVKCSVCGREEIMGVQFSVLALDRVVAGLIHTAACEFAGLSLGEVARQCGVLDVDNPYLRRSPILP